MKKLLVLATVSATVYGAWQLFDRDDARPATDGALVTDRVWLDRLPRGERDTINVFLTITDESLGVFQAGSRWRGAYELFTFEAHGGELRVLYPQTGERESLHAKVTTCNEGAMDYCLELKGGSRGVQRYYSMKGWEIDGSADVEAARAKAAAILSQPR